MNVEVILLKKDAKMAQACINNLQKMMQSLEQSNQMKEVHIPALNPESSRMECNELVVRRSSLEEKYRNLLSMANSKSEEVQLLKMDVYSAE